MPEGVPQILPSPSSESHVTLSQAQEASSVAESQQIILSAPVPVVPRTTDRSSTPQSLPDQFKTPELLVDNSVLQQGDDDTHRSRAIPPSPPSSKAKISPKPLHRKPITDTNGHEVERIVSESSSQSLPDPVGDSSDSQRDDIVHGETANVEDSITQYENPLQKELDDEIHQQAADVIKEVSGGRRNVKTDRQRPFDPNLVCPMCRRQFRIGEIQKFKKHVNTCTGTDDNN